MQTTKRTPLPPSVKLLRARGLTYTKLHNGTQLVIRVNRRVFDFWPKSGKWRERSQNSACGEFALHRISVKTGVGVEGLLKQIEETNK